MCQQHTSSSDTCVQATLAVLRSDVQDQPELLMRDRFGMGDSTTSDQVEDRQQLCSTVSHMVARLIKKLKEEMSEGDCKLPTSCLDVLLLKTQPAASPGRAAAQLIFLLSSFYKTAFLTDTETNSCLSLPGLGNHGNTLRLEARRQDDSGSVSARGSALVLFPSEGRLAFWLILSNLLPLI